MKCPVCNHTDIRVLESRDGSDDVSIRRRRECAKCGARFTTYERIEIPHLMVIKKSGERESYDRAKLARGIYRAVEKRPVSAEVVEQMLAKLEQTILSGNKQEITSQELGEMVMKELIVIDDVAYVRFASVYRSFTDLESFEKEFYRLKKRQKPQK
ncbi:MAG: transcriptional regulator NrdR [Candidatus Saccharibacteria bacterium]